MTLLPDVQNLVVDFGPVRNPVRVVNGIPFTGQAGESMGIVGESGSGKSMTALSILRLVNEPPVRVSGKVPFQGRDLMQIPKHDMPAIRGKEIGMIFQEPMSSLNPVMTIGDQIGGAIYLHEDMSKAERASG